MNYDNNDAEVISLEEYKLRRIEALKKRHRLSIVKALDSHGGQGHCDKHNIYYRILGSDDRCPECAKEGGI
jgi:hypothetical protein